MRLRTLPLLALLVLAGPISSIHASTEAEVKALILKFCDSWHTGAEAAFLSTLDDSFHFSNPGGTFDHKQILEQFRASSKNYADIRFYHYNIVIQGDRFMAEYQYCSTDRSTGKREADGTVVVGELKDGKLITWKEYYDPSVGDLQASGKLVVDEGGPAYPYPHSAPNRW